MGADIYGRNVTDFIKTSQWWTTTTSHPNKYKIVTYGGNLIESTDYNAGHEVVPAIWLDMTKLPTTYDIYSKTDTKDINYNLFGGKNASENPSTYTVGVGVDSLKDPTRTGYTFAGWYDSLSYANKINAISKVESCTINLYALWEPTYVYFGTYPQSEVTDADTIGKINKVLGADNTGDCYVGKVRYRKCKKEDSTLGKYWGTEKYRYFKWERIKWRILEVDDATHKALAVAADALDSRSYNNTYGDITWKDSSLRTWLNDAGNNSSFISTAFTSEEQKGIFTTTLYNSEQSNKAYKDFAGDNTQDKIFLLSQKDATNTAYRYDPRDWGSDSRKPQLTSYAQAMGFANTEKKDCIWWLRSPGFSKKNAAVVNEDGEIIYMGLANATGVLVVPALAVDYTSKYVYTLKEGMPNGTSFKISYVLNGGTNSKSNPSTYKKGTGIPSFAPASRTGYAFEGWFSDAKLTKKVSAVSADTEEDITLYAKWTRIKADNTFSVKNVTKDISKKKISIKLATLTDGASNGATLSYELNGSYNKDVTLDSKKGVISVKAKYAGTIKVTITSSETADYKKTVKEAVITIAPAKVKGLKVKSSGKGTAVVSWKTSTFADGYEIKYGQQKDLSKAKGKNAKKTAKSYTIKKLKSKKPCYVEVRAYKKVKGGKVYSAPVKANIKKVK